MAHAAPTTGAPFFVIGAEVTSAASCHTALLRSVDSPGAFACHSTARAIVLTGGLGQPGGGALSATLEFLWRLGFLWWTG
eukprot:COSAG05_NODE_1680_length_4291_cov_2.546040_5_plen_80_part_00